MNLGSAERDPTKYIPVTEDEYHEFKEHKRIQMKRMQESIANPPILGPLTHAEDQKIQTLFNPSIDPESQEKRFNDLWHTINSMRQKLATSQTLPSIPPRNPNESMVSSFNPSSLGNGNMQLRAQKLLDNLGPSVWNEKGELVVDGTPVPNSNVNELMKYAVTDWRSKFSGTQPNGSAELLSLIRASNIQPGILGRKLQAEVSNISDLPETSGYAMSNKKAKRLSQRNLSSEAKGLEIVSSRQKFDETMKKTKKKKK
jgi:hypothetical protein